MKSLLIIGMLSIGSLTFAQAPAEAYRADVIRSTTGRILNERGLSDGVVSLEKGRSYNVVEQKVGYVVISVSGKNVSVPPGDVSLTKGAIVPPDPARVPPQTAVQMPQPQQAPAPQPVTPGKIELISAKYTLRGNQPRNVKTKLAKLIPEGQITQTVNVLVSDALSTAAQAQGNFSVMPYGNRSYTYQEHAKNILTVEYMFNGEVRTKQALEGTYLTLP